MNTKTTKFLAVLAVFAMAFAAFAVIAPAEINDAATGGAEVVAKDGEITTPDVKTAGGAITGDMEHDWILVSDPEAAYTLDAGTATGGTMAIYLLPGASVTVTGTNSAIEWTFAAAYLKDSKYCGTTGSKFYFGNGVDVTCTITNVNGVIVIEASAPTATVFVPVLATTTGSAADLKLVYDADQTTETNAKGFASVTTEYKGKVDLSGVTNGVTTLTAAGPVIYTGGVIAPNDVANAVKIVGATGKEVTGVLKTKDGKVEVSLEKFAGTTGTDKVFDNVTGGMLTLVKGEFTCDGKTIDSGATVNVASGATLIVKYVANTTKLTVKGALYISGTIKSDDIDNAAIILVKDEAASAAEDKSVFKTRLGATMTKINFDSLSRGTVDIDSVLNDVGLSGQIESSNSYTASQIVTLLGDLTITNHAKIEIHGYLVIPSGCTLKIDAGSVLIVDGVYSETEVYGVIEVSKDSALYVKNDKSFEIYGTMTTNASGDDYASLLVESSLTTVEGSTLDLAGRTLVNAGAVLTIDTGATVYVSGPIMTAGATANVAVAGSIENAGNLVFDGAALTTLKASTTKTGFVEDDTAADSTIAIMITADGAIVDVESLKFVSYGTNGSTLTVTDKGIKASLLWPAAEYYNTITVTSSEANQAISGLVIGEKVSATTVSKVDYTKNNMQISGEIAVTAGTTATLVPAIKVTQNKVTEATSPTAYGTFTIEDELELLEGVVLTFDGAQNVIVNGDVKVENKADIKVANSPKIVVKGSIDSYAELGSLATACDTYAACVGAQFKADTHSYIITTVPAAMTFAAVQEDKVTVTIYGANTVDDDMYITANVKMIGTGSITIKKDVTVEVIEGASVAVKITVNGTLYANVEKNITGTVIADVKVTDGVAAKWTSLANALATAEAGDVILITNSTLKISDNLTIPVDVTVVIPDGTATTIVDKKTLTVNGALVSDSPITLDLTKGAKIVVNGLARFVGSDPASTYQKYSIDAAYYTEDNYVYVSNLELASQSEVTAITIYGTVTESKEVSFALQTITLADGAVLKVSDLVLSGLADVNAEKGTLSGTITAAGLDGEAVAIMHFTDYAGCVGNYFGDLVGTAFIDEITGTVSIMSGTVTLFSEEPIENGGTLNVILGAEFIVYDDKEVTISKGTNTGTIYVAGKLTIDSDKFVNAGIIDVVFDEEDSIKGVLTITAITMEIGGITVDDGAVFNLNGDLTLGYAATSVDGVAAIEGVVKLADGKYIIAYANADVSEMIVNPNADGASTAKTTEFYINDMLYMTLIAGSTNEITYKSVIEKLTFAIEELDETQLAALKTSAGWGIKDSDTIGTYDELSAEIDYKLIAIQASWVKGLSLYVDGVRISVPGELKLSVGVHLVSVTVDAGYACDNIGITFNGVAVTPAGIFVEVDDTGSVLAVTGDVYIPEPEPVTPEEKSEWTITTILLVVLVILIAIMAVIVALRLNRS